MLFKKAAVFGDLHLGKRSDSPIHNKDCSDFIDWFCENAKNENVDRIIFVGDWFDNQSRIRIDTQHYGDTLMKKLLSVAPVDIIVGNHDMFNRSSRDVHSVNGYDKWDNVTVHNDVVAVDGVGFVPYLVGTEYLQVMELDVKYIFGHLELPTFLMNSTIAMPDKGGLSADKLIHPDMVFSGHFHQRQLKSNHSGIPIWYIGSPFGMDFNDVGDTERGMMILEWGGEPKFIDWDDGPLFQRFSTSEIVDMLENNTLVDMVRPRSVLEIRDDMRLDLDDISVLRDELDGIVRESRVIPSAQTPSVENDDVEVELEDKQLQQIVVEHLELVDPHGTNIDPVKLVQLFLGENKA